MRYAVRAFAISLEPIDVSRPIPLQPIPACLFHLSFTTSDRLRFFTYFAIKCVAKMSEHTLPLRLTIKTVYH